MAERETIVRDFGAARTGEQGDTLQKMVTDRLSFQAEDDASDEELGAGFGNPVRRSGESAGDGARSRRTSTTQSRRSSFALERASFEANRSSLEMFGVQAAARHSAPALPQVRHRLTVRTRCMSQAAAAVLAGAPVLAGVRCCTESS